MRNTGRVIVLLISFLIVSGCTSKILLAIGIRGEALHMICETETLHVSTLGNDGGTGTEGDPKSSLNEAIVAGKNLVEAGLLDVVTLKVAEGDYRVEHTLQIPNWLCITGGYSSTWTYDPDLYRTTITFSGVETAIHILQGDGNQACLVDLWIDCSGGETNTAVLCRRSAKILGNTISARGTDNSIGVLVEEADPLIEGNTIISEGSNDNSWGVAVDGGSPLIINNVIKLTTGIGIQVAIHNTNGSSSRIINNTVHSPAKTGDIMLLNSTSHCTIENNIFYSTNVGTGIREADQSSDPNSLKNNDFIGCTSPIYHTHDAQSLIDIVSLETYLGVVASGNILDSDPGFIDITQDDYHISVNPISGINRSDLSTHDHDGNERTVPWSIGAYELD